MKPTTTVLLSVFSLFLFVLSSSLVFADDCTLQNACFSGETPYCSPNADTCVYVSYEQSGNECVKSAVVDGDEDQDGWTDNCDAFVGNASEWIDLDADGIGHNVDCDDFDFTIGLCDIPSEDEEDEEDSNQGGSIGNSETTSGSSSTSSSSTTSQRNYKGNVGDIVVKTVNETTPSVQQPLEKEPVVLKSQNTTEEPIINETQPLQTTTPTNKLTGNVIEESGIENVWDFGFYLLLALIVFGLFLFFIIKKRRKQE